MRNKERIKSNIGSAKDKFFMGSKDACLVDLEELKLEVFIDIRDQLVELNRNLCDEDGINWKLDRIAQRLEK